MTQRSGIQIRCRGCGKGVWSFNIYDVDDPVNPGNKIPMHTVNDPDPQECGPVDGGTV